MLKCWSRRWKELEPVPSFEVTAFGETMLRLSVPSGQRLTKMRQLDVHVGGAETNVLGALSSLGRRCGWVSALPATDLGRFVLRELAAARIDSSAVVLKAGRIGTYYVEFAAAPRAVQVIYDRADAAVSTLTPGDIDWDYLLDTRVLHLTGITAALGPGCYDVTLEAYKRAKDVNVTTSFDVNYRSKLWSAETAKEKLEPILKNVDILVCGEGDAQTVFGLSGSPEAVLEGLKDLSGAAHIILTRSDEGSAVLIDGELVQVEAGAAEMIDRLGAGDAFTAGVIDGFLDGDIVEGMRRGTALAGLALTQHGDMVSTSRPELGGLLRGGQGRLVR